MLHGFVQIILCSLHFHVFVDRFYYVLLVVRQREQAPVPLLLESVSLWFVLFKLHHVPLKIVLIRALFFLFRTQLESLDHGPFPSRPCKRLLR